MYLIWPPPGEVLKISLSQNQKFKKKTGEKCHKLILLNMYIHEPDFSISLYPCRQLNLYLSCFFLEKRHISIFIGFWGRCYLNTAVETIRYRAFICTWILLVCLALSVLWGAFVFVGDRRKEDLFYCCVWIRSKNIMCRHVPKTK